MRPYSVDSSRNFKLYMYVVYRDKFSFHLKYSMCYRQLWYYTYESDIDRKIAEYLELDGRIFF